MLEVNIPENVEIKYITESKKYEITNNKEYLNNFKYFISFCLYNPMGLYNDQKSFGFHLYKSAMNIICGENYTTYKQPAIKKLLELNNINYEEIYDEYCKGLRI